MLSICPDLSISNDEKSYADTLFCFHAECSLYTHFEFGCVALYKVWSWDLNSPMKSEFQFGIFISLFKHLNNIEFHYPL